MAKFKWKSEEELKKEALKSQQEALSYEERLDLLSDTMEEFMTLMLGEDEE